MRTKQTGSGTAGGPLPILMYLGAGRLGGWEGLSTQPGDSGPPSPQENNKFKGSPPSLPLPNPLLASPWPQLMGKRGPPLKWPL